MPSGNCVCTARWFGALFAVLAALPAAAHTITGIVVGPDGPVKGARVSFHYESNPGVPGHQDVTGADGRFSGPAPDGQILFLGATPPSGSPLNPFFDGIGLKITRDHDTRIRLRRTVRISGEIRNASGQRVAGTVRFYSMTMANAAVLDRYARQSPVAEVETSVGTFSAELPGDYYSIHAAAKDALLPSGRTNVDARANVSGVRVTLTGREGRLMPVRGPRADRIAVSPPDSGFNVTLTGGPGATDAYTAVRAVNMMTGQTTVTVSGADGSFVLAAAAAPGATLALYHDPTGWYVPVAPNNAPGTPTTYVSVPNAAGEAVASGPVNFELDQATARTLETFGALDGGQWIVRGGLPDREWAPGETIALSGTLAILSRNLGSDVSSVQVSGGLGLVVRFDAAGRQRASDKTFHSTELTPTGFGIERVANELFLAALQVTNLRSGGPGRADADWSATFTVPDLPAAIVQPRFGFAITGVPNTGRFLDAPVALGGTAFTANAFWPLVELGDPAPPRLALALGVNDFDNGTRGTVAVEDRGAFQLANHVALQGDSFVLPVRDPRTGVPVRHRFEPFLPMLTGFDSLRCASPIPFGSGTLRVRVRRPDGQVDDLGEAPLRQMESRLVLTRSDLRQALGTAGLPAVNELTTLDERFEYAFALPGTHLVEMTAAMTDVWGRSYTGGGTYEVVAARTLDIDGGVVIGTPFESGDVFSAAAVLSPPVPAEVELRIRHLPDSDPERAVESVVRGRANRFGYFAADGIPMKGAGEFSVTMRATYLDPEGEAWAGEVRWGSVVASPQGDVVVHGRRGFQDANVVGQQWFTFSNDDLHPGDHVMYPFHAGDVLWIEDTDRFSGVAASPTVALQDNAGALGARIRERYRSFQPVLGSQTPFAEREAAGELPLFSSGALARNDFGPPEQWGYAYLYAERPSVRVREMVTEDSTGAAYWRFRDQYHFQPGVGIEGDRENDFKFQFGGAVYRDETDGFRFYGAYASLFVLVPERSSGVATEKGRIMPPFQGNGGGPDGGPLFTLKGKEIDLFFHPTAVRPGSILQRGDRISFAGYSAPTLASKVEVMVTSPSGVVRTVYCQASAVGYAYDPAQDFRAFESGVWRAKVRIVFDGRTSAGQVTAPHPSGDVLGSRDGEFYFYVVDPDEDQLELGTLPRFVRPADGPIAFSIVRPSGLAEASLKYTVTMPGFILEEGTKTSLSYSYDARALAKSFPNLDPVDLDGYGGVDPITISFLVSGKDGAGRIRYFARQVVIQGEEVQMPDQRPRGKRRAVRR